MTLPPDNVDIFVIGGGINGCGIARDAVGRGYSVCLAEMNDLASGTSSWSTKLIHGGLRYLEHYEFRLVREALRERELLWANAPHIIRPLRFVLPHHAGLRPAWMLRLGLFLYDHLGGRRLLPAARSLNLRRDPAGLPLKPDYVRGFEYSDCWVDDARLVVLNARDAADRGATVLTRTAVTAARRDGGLWRITLRTRDGGAEREVAARMLVNAGGPWVDRVLALSGAAGRHRIRLVQGSHIVVPRLFDHDRCYIFQNTDGRIVFAIPYEGDFTLIGTTDRDYEGDPADVAITPEETEYLCAAVSDYFRVPVRAEQVVWSYSGVRPLYDDGASSAQEATRDYVLSRDGGADGTPALVSIFGGKLTTYRRLGETVLEHVEAVLGAQGPAWTKRAPLPGGDFPVTGFDPLVARLQAEHPYLASGHARRLARLYGTRAWSLLEGGEAGLGRHFGADLYEAELRFLVAEEWAATAEDVLWRRTKLGLRLDADRTAAVAAAMAELRAALPDRR